MQGCETKLSQFLVLLGCCYLPFFLGMMMGMPAYVHVDLERLTKGYV